MQKVLVFKHNKLKLLVIRETSKYIITNTFVPFGIGRLGKKTAKWDKDTKECLDSSEPLRFKNIINLEIHDINTY